jgi:hypothetical protein
LGEITLVIGGAGGAPEDVWDEARVREALAVRLEAGAKPRAHTGDRPPEIAAVYNLLTEPARDTDT